VPPFVVFCQPRTGSYHLVSLLGSAPDIVCHGEVFKPGRIELLPQALAALGIAADDVAARNADPVGFVERLQALSTPAAILGFKLFVNHLVAQKGLRRAVLLAPGWRKIVLQRDPVRTYASRLRAEQTGVWTLPVGRTQASALLHAPVRFEAGDFERHLQEHEKFRRLVDAAAAVPGNPVLRLDYDDLLQADDARPGEAGLAAVLRFVGSAAAPGALRSTMQRQYTGDFRAGFTNWPEFEAHLVARGLGVPAGGKTHES
jgi:LPS sulfotransferase NodH